MADLAFFDRQAPLTLTKLAEITGADISGVADKDLTLLDVAPLDVATSSDLSFLDNVKYKEQFTQTKAGACFIHPNMAEIAPEGCALLITPTPYKAYALAAQAFYPQNAFAPEISEHAAIHPDAVIGQGCRIDAFAVIGKDAKIGDNCWIENGVSIGEGVQLGNHNRIGANASVSHAILSDHVRLYPGVRVGQDGFGFAIDMAGFVKVPQLGRVIIESHVEIGANTTIDRGAGPDTVIGQGTWIDNLVQIGHNVKIGKGCIIVSQVGISGSTTIGDYCAIGGQVGIAGHLEIATGTRVAAQSGIMKNTQPGQEVMGSPALPIKDFMRQTATLKRLIKKKKTA